MDKAFHRPASVTFPSLEGVGGQPASSAGEAFGRTVEECVICQEAMLPERQTIRTLSCNSGSHSFHAPCIDHWLRGHSDCPVCRSPVETRDAHARAPASYVSLNPAHGAQLSAPQPQARVAENRSRGSRVQQQLCLNPVIWSEPEHKPEGAPCSQAEALAPGLSGYIAQGDACWVQRVLSFGACPGTADREAMLQALERAISAGNLDEMERWLQCVPLTDGVRELMSTAMERAAGAENNPDDIAQYAWLLGFGINPSPKAVMAVRGRMMHHAEWKNLAQLEAWLSLGISPGVDVEAAIEESRTQLLHWGEDRAEGWSELLNRLQ